MGCIICALFVTMPCIYIFLFFANNILIDQMNSSEPLSLLCGGVQTKRGKGRNREKCGAVEASSVTASRSPRENTSTDACPQ